MERVVVGRWAMAFAASVALAGFGMGDARAQSSGDAGLGCKQITDQFDQQNAIVKEKNDDRAQLQNARPDPGARDPEIQERLDDIAAGKATARANTLLALGRQKKCFR